MKKSSSAQSWQLFFFSSPAVSLLKFQIKPTKERTSPTSLSRKLKKIPKTKIIFLTLKKTYIILFFGKDKAPLKFLEFLLPKKKKKRDNLPCAISLFLLLCTVLNPSDYFCVHFFISVSEALLELTSSVNHGPSL